MRVAIGLAIPNCLGAINSERSEANAQWRKAARYGAVVRRIKSQVLALQATVRQLARGAV